MSLPARLVGKSRRVLAQSLYRKPVVLDLPRPVISFAFDDAPVTAFTTGADILARHDARATYYVCLGLLGQEIETGLLGSAEHLANAVAQGHELGCHTYDHLDAWHVSTARYVDSIERNRQALEGLMPDYRFGSFSYPKSGPTAWVKAHASQRFGGCRGGGQCLNAGTVDLGLLSACFIDRRTNVDLSFVKALIAETIERKGWLILATHDVCADPSPYGVAPDFLESVVAAAHASGAALTPVGDVSAALRVRAPLPH